MIIVYIVTGVLIIIGLVLVYCWLSAIAKTLVQNAVDEVLPYVHVPSPPKTETDDGNSDG